MKSSIFAAAALMGAVASGSVFRRQEGSGPRPPTSGNGNLPCGATSTTPYTVVLGDTLNTISASTGVGVCDIAAASHITNINVIELNQVLAIPVDCTSIDNSTCVPSPTPEPTETCVLGLPSNYYVRSGDSLSAIAASFNITLPSLIAANTQISNPDAIGVGQSINIPVCPRSNCETVGTYVIAKGDVYVDLATRGGVTVGQILALNPSVAPEKLDVGQQIIRPYNCRNITVAPL